MFKLFEAVIIGTSPLLQHRFSESAEGEVQRKTRKNLAPEPILPRTEAEKAAYRMEETGQLYMPSMAISRLLRESGSDHKLKGSRKSAKFVVPSSVFIDDEVLMLLNPEDGKPLMDFEVDSRPVVIPSTKGRIMRHRPRLDSWALSVILRVDTESLGENFIRELLIEGGMRRGLGDFRPEKGGPFGRFHLTSWKPLGDWKQPEVKTFKKAAATK